MSGLDVRRLGRAAHETSFRPAALDLANEGTPRSGAAAQGRLFFGYFLLAKQKKVARRQAERSRSARAAHQSIIYEQHPKKSLDHFRSRALRTSTEVIKYCRAR